MALRSFEGRVSAVTGAASGIGRALAEELSRRGSHLALCDVDEAGLSETEALCSGRGVKVTARRIDVSSRREMFEWADTVNSEHGRVNAVLNSAGVALVAPVHSMTIEDLEWVMAVDFWGVVHGTKAFLPHLLRSGEGHVVNLSSVFGLASVPAQSAYNAAKFAVRGFSDALRMELDVQRAEVSCTTVYPGGVRTRIARNARLDARAADVGADVEHMADRFEQRAMTSPESAARQILDGVLRNRRRVLVGADARALDGLSRLSAGLYQRAVVAGARLSRRFS